MFARWFSPARRPVRRDTLRPYLEGLEDRSVPATFTVTNTDDNGGVNPAPFAGTGTLRQAIIDANASPGRDTIAFAIGTGVQTITITPGVRLPFVTDPADIDGRTQPGYAGAPLVQVTGAGQVDMGLALRCDSSVRGLILNRCTHNSLALGGAGNVVQGNYIGTNPSGTVSAGSGQLYGIVIDGANNNLIGTNGDGVDDAAERNVISGLGGGAIIIHGSYNRVAGNYIGTDPTGTAAVPNNGGGQPGVVDVRGGTGNIIGTNGSNDAFNANERNVISGNNNTGINIWSGVTDTWIAGNYVGLNAVGDAALPNFGCGINTGVAPTTRIGTDADGVADAAERNVISGTLAGPGVVGVGIIGGVIAGNYIGTDATGTFAIGNAEGIRNGVLIGTNGDGVHDAAERNVISGNGVGVNFFLSSGGVLAGNYIGTDATGTVAVGNGPGVFVVGGSGARIGVNSNGDSKYNGSERNVIAGNTNGGIHLRAGATDASVAGNYIGIDAAGMKSLPNNATGSSGEVGISIFAGAYGNLIGTNADGVADADERNVIADGVSINSFGGPAGPGNVVAGNYIGLRKDATPGGTGGLSIGGVAGTRVGTNGDGVNDAAEANVIAGMTLAGPGATGNVIAGNYFGTDPTGTASLNIDWRGILIAEGASGNRVENNVIGGYTGTGLHGHGVYLDGDAARKVTNNRMVGNFIGVARDGTPLGNTGYGIYAGSQVLGTLVEGNAIAHNGRAGVWLQWSEDTATITRNAIGPNGGLGIDLNNGANHGQTAPVLTAATCAAVTGTLASTPNSTFRIEFFANTAADPSGSGEGERYLGFIDVTTDAAGNAAFTAPSFPLLAGEKYLTATATRLVPSGTTWVPTDTSEFSNAVAVNVAPTAGVTGPAAGVRGQPLTYTLTATDPDSPGPFTFRIDWDGTTDQTVSGPSGTTVTHTYTDAGTYPVRVTATDGPGCTSPAAQLAVTVHVALVQADPCESGKQALFVGGTTGADNVVVSPATGGAVQVQIGGVLIGTYSPTGRVVVYAQAGDDDVTVAGSIALPAWLYGDGGNDRLKGGAGHDVLLGQAGDDLLVGGGSRDLLIGGAGADRIVGNDEDDILIAGVYLGESDPGKLCAVMREWTRTDRTAEQRVSNLRSGGADAFNGSVLLNADSLRTDAEADILTGSAGYDWFLFDSTKDRVTDLNDTAFSSDLAFINQS